MIRPAVSALVPVCAFAESKRRLSPLLAPEERHALARTMLEDALDCLGRTAAVAEILIVGDDTEAGALASDYGARALPDAPGGLNASLTAAVAWARAGNPEVALLILHADLPAATPEDIEALIGTTADVALARAPDGGTNAMALRPGVTLPFAFGPESCARHRAAAGAAGLTVAIVERPGLALDLDRPEDIAAYLARAGNSRTLGLLHKFGVPARLRAKADR